MKEKTETILAWCIGGTITIALLGGYSYLLNANDNWRAEKKAACASIDGKVFSDTQEGRIAAEAVCNDQCMFRSVDELVNDYGLKEPSVIYQAAKTKCSQ